MKALFPIISVFFVLQLTGCALLSFNRQEDVDPDPVATAARRVREPASTEIQNESTDEAQEREALRQQTFSNARRRGDVVMGMSQKDVVTALGQPDSIETAGAPGGGNERWIYYQGLSGRLGLGNARLVYFENGNVAGWDTAHP